jgi:predicted AAA+ superfamily ATPase
VSLSTHVTPRASVFDASRTDTVLSLDDVLNDNVDAAAFFAESYVTAGMHTLIERAFQRLSGTAAGSPVFSLTQAMGGGKTHSMIALALLAKHPEVRAAVFREWFDGNDLAKNLGAVRVIGFNGRNTDAKFGIWGELADQLGRRQHFADNYSPLQAPGQYAWEELLRGDPLIILLDELPPYLSHAVSMQIGDSNLANVTASALANLLVAVAGLQNVTVVISDLGGQAWAGGSDVLIGAIVALRNLSFEVDRIALKLSPVNPQTDELYRI